MNLIKTNASRHVIITPEVQISFPQLFEAKSFQDKAGLPKEFKVDLIFQSKEDLTTPQKKKDGSLLSLMQAINNVKTDQWGSDKSKWPEMEYPAVKKGDERTNKDGEIYQGYEGKFFVTAKSGEKYPPLVLLPSKEAAKPSDISGGCWAKAAILVRPYVFGKKNGVTLRLLALMKTNRKADVFGGGGAQKDFFDDEPEEVNFDDEEDFEIL